MTDQRFDTPQEVSDALLRHYVRAEPVRTDLALEPLFEIQRETRRYRRRRLQRYAGELAEDGTCSLALDAVTERATSHPDVESIAYDETALTYVGVLLDISHRYDGIERRGVTRKLNGALEGGVAEDPDYEALFGAGVAVYDLASLVVDGELLARHLDRYGERDDVVFAHPEESVDTFEGRLHGAVLSRDEEALARLQRRLLDTVSREWTRADLLAFDPIAFEYLLARLWEANHNSTRVTRARQDRGVDVVVRMPSGDVVLIQAKRYAPGNTVGISEVQRTAGLLHEFAASRAVVATSASFTRSATESAQAMRDVRLVDGETLCTELSGSPLCPPVDATETPP